MCGWWVTLTYNLTLSYMVYLVVNYTLLLFAVGQSLIYNVQHTIVKFK